MQTDAVSRSNHSYDEEDCTKRIAQTVMKLRLIYRVVSDETYVKTCIIRLVPVILRMYSPSCVASSAKQAGCAVAHPENSEELNSRRAENVWRCRCWRI